MQYPTSDWMSCWNQHFELKFSSSYVKFELEIFNEVLKIFSTAGCSNYEVFIIKKFRLQVTFNMVFTFSGFSAESISTSFVTISLELGVPSEIQKAHSKFNNLSQFTHLTFCNRLKRNVEFSQSFWHIIQIVSPQDKLSNLLSTLI